MTVAICTWNRAALLDRTLADLARQAVPAGIGWEVVVVDNNCTDATAAVCDRHAGNSPLRRVVEPKQGHSHARNCAVDHARGDLMLWTDDDVRVPEHWLAEYVRAATDYPDATFFGGPVRPGFADDFPTAARRLVEENIGLLAPVYALKDYGPAVRPFAADEVPFGANMGYRTAVLRQVRFDPTFGRVGAGLIGADEVAVLTALKAAGHAGVYVGPAAVRHHIPPDRATLPHVWNFFAALGRTQVRLDGLPACPTVLGRPRWVLAEHLKARGRAWANRARNRPGWLADYLTAAKLAGYLAEAAAPANRRRRPGYLIAPHPLARTA